MAKRKSAVKQFEELKEQIAVLADQRQEFLVSEISSIREELGEIMNSSESISLREDLKEEIRLLGRLIGLSTKTKQKESYRKSKEPNTKIEDKKKLIMDLLSSASKGMAKIELLNEAEKRFVKKIGPTFLDRTIDALLNSKTIKQQGKKGTSPMFVLVNNTKKR